MAALGRSELRHLTNWNDGQPGTELNFKLIVRSNKVVWISADAAAFLGGILLASSSLAHFPRLQKARERLPS